MAAARARHPEDVLKLLVLTSRPIRSRQSGYDLRVAHLCTHLPAEAHLVVVPVLSENGAAGPADGGLEVDEVFASERYLCPIGSGRPSRRRHLRGSQDHVLERFHPHSFARARDELRAVVRELGITHLIVFGGDMAELAATVEGTAVVLDVCDSTVLTMQRALYDSPRPSRGLRRWKDRLALWRAHRTEVRYPARFDRVVAISAPDARAVEGRRRPERSVAVVPNGIDEALLGAPGVPGPRRGVAFWGNLAFGPNQDALWFLVHDIWLPFLRPARVELCVVGSSAPRWLVELAVEEPGIVLTGYVEDLRAVVTSYPIMINPMRTGSGLKNKVLEAFGLGLVVVTTPRGVDAIPELVVGEHAVCEADPSRLATAVTDLLDDRARLIPLRDAARTLVEDRYRWEAVGRTWRSLVGSVPERDGSRRL